ncbi:protein EcsC [Paracoccus suum]|uniref:Protein EcsC n=1 Tax=Paracoccus suum TaxID=2259340 RepID=A0A344PGU8_9RHOB|nr:EcsC family protein [Paracoccus suum]AXC48603.1 protein EcsC [Paracoccus suum]
MTTPAPRQEILPPITDPTVRATIERLARIHKNAGGLGMEVLSTIGGSAEGMLRKLPAFVRNRIDRIVRTALESAIHAASASRSVVRDRSDLVNRLASTASGAIGGLGGLPGAMIELPVTITMLMRAIMAIAAEHGFDPEDDRVKAEALRVFAAAGPFEADDGTDLGLLAAKVSITGQTLQGLVARVAPRLAGVLGQKVAAQATPVLGAVAGASINFTFTRYYQQVARVHFGLWRLSEETGIPRAALAEALERRLIEIDPRHGARKA